MYTPKQHDPVAISSYLHGSAGHERVRRLLDAERRGRKWTIALGPEPATAALLEALATTKAITVLLEQQNAPMVLWTGPDLAA